MAQLQRFDSWAAQLQARLPNLLTADEVARRERLLIKLLSSPEVQDLLWQAVQKAFSFILG